MDDLKVNFTPGQSYRLEHPQGVVAICRYCSDGMVSMWIASGSHFWATEPESVDNFELINVPFESMAGHILIRRVR